MMHYLAQTLSLFHFQVSAHDERDLESICVDWVPTLLGDEHETENIYML